MKKDLFVLAFLFLFTNIPAQEQESPLFNLVLRSDLEGIKKLVEAGEDVNQFNQYGVTPLTNACGIGNYQIVNYLLDNGANPDGVSDKPDAYTPLTQAVHSGHLDIVKLLLAYGADELKGYEKTEIISIDGKVITQTWSPTRIARNENQGDILYFLENYLIKSSHNVRRLTAEGNIGGARSAIKDGWGANGCDYRGRTTLMVAAHDQNYSRIIDVAVENGADPKAKDREGKTLLHHYAMCRTERIDGMKQCLKEFNLGLNDKDKFGNSAFLLSAWNQCPDNIEYLLDAGSDINDKDGWGNPALCLALKRGKNRDGEEPLDAVKMLLKYKANLELADSENGTPVFYAVWKELPECTGLLLDKGANVNVVQKNGWNLVHQAVNCSSDEVSAQMLEMVLQKKPTTINERYEGKTALTFAKDNGYSKCVEMLESAGGVQ